jgi:TolA-binding protein
LYDARPVNKFSILLGLAIALAGCASQSSEPAADSQAAAAAQTTPNSDEPRTVTDLSQISSAQAAQPQMPQLNAPNSSAVDSKHNPNAMVQQNIERLFVSNLNQLRYHEGRADAPGDTTLLNDKARRFSEFSYQLLNQTLAAARAIEPDRLAGRKLPEDIAPMVLTAVMDSEGRLTEISIESHSGDHQVDEIIIDSCKQGLWSRNPPEQALGSDGMYRVRIRGYIRAYSFDLKGRYKYETEFALGIL